MHTADRQKMIWSIFVFILSSSSSLSEQHYNGHKVFKLLPKTAYDALEIVKLEQELALDFWNYPRTSGEAFHVRVPSQHLQLFEHKLENIRADVTEWIHDVQSLIDEERQSIQQSRLTSASSTFDFQTYNGYGAIQAYLNSISSGTSQADVQVKSIGTTYEGRSISMIKLSSKSSVASKNIFLDCGIHAREWISPAFCMYVINEIANNPDSSSLLQNYNWHIVPVVNPDGYEYSHSNSQTRLWRKNRYENSGTTCKGVDINRNFGYEYNPNVGGSTNPCSETYTGEGAFSEAESQAVSNYILNEISTGNDFKAYLTIHSYGQMWLYPWGYTSALPSDWQDLHAVAEDACSVLRSVNKMRYTVGSSTNVLYSAAGGSDDWAKGSAKIKYAYTLELRDTGRYGFVLPTNEIQPTCIETWEAIKAMASTIE